MAVFSLLFNINSILLSRQTYKQSFKFLVLFLSPVLIREQNGREKDENRKRWQSEEPLKWMLSSREGGLALCPPPPPPPRVLFGWGRGRVVGDQCGGGVP